MSEPRKWTLAIRQSQDEAPRKITKIIGLNADGFSVLAPYHKARSGFLFKLPVDPKHAITPGPWFVPATDVVAFTVEDRAKLSYHTDGFVQFSSENPGKIISGRDPSSGEPKGLGVMSRPLTDPIWSGPSASVTAWGLDDFDLADERKNLIVFEPDEIYYRACAPGQKIAFHLEVYAFPVDVVPPVRFRNGHPVMDTTVHALNRAMAAIVSMKVILLPEERVFLGVYVNAMANLFPSVSGWVLGGAGKWGPDRPGFVLKGVYPRDLFPQPYQGSLDRIPKPGQGEQKSADAASEPPAAGST
jgi:hypothetical protein